MIEALLQPSAWGSPLGIGVFLVCLGVFLYLLKAANQKDD